MGNLDGGEYMEVKPPDSYPDLLLGGSRDARGSALSAEAVIREWQSRPEYQARQAQLAEAANQRRLAENIALFDALMARRATAAPATAVTDVAEVADGQAQAALGAIEA